MELFKEINIIIYYLKILLCVIRSAFIQFKKNWL